MTFVACILCVVHYILALRTTVLNWLMRVNKWWHLDYWKSSSKSAKIQTGANENIKLPAHIGLVIVDENISYGDLANMLVWCIASGINHISIYDRAGVCKGGREVLRSSLEKQKAQVLGPASHRYDVHFHTSRVVKTSVDDSSSHHVDIVLLSVEDGRGHLISTTRRLAALVQQGEYKTSDINPSNVDNMLLDHHGFPDPDLVLRFGVTNSLLGFLPWQMRLTEILSYPTHHKIDYNTFRQLLVAFGETEQRFGK